MSKGVFQVTIVDDEGNVLPYASVTFRYTDGSLADLYSDVIGTPLVGNPQTADAYGFIQVYLDPGVFHDITASSNGHTKTWNDYVASIEFSNDFAESIAAADAKTTTVDADIFAILDSAASFVLKTLTFANLKTVLSTLYQPLSSVLTNTTASFTTSDESKLDNLYSSTFGVIVSNGTDATNDIDFSAGVRRNSTNAYTIVAGAMTKRADATWAAGTGNGGMASGVTWAANDFHLFLLGKSTDPTAHDYIFDTSLTCANGLADAAVITAGFDIYKRVSSLRTASAAWPLISAREIATGLIEYLLKTPVFQLEKDWSGNDDTAQTGTLGAVPGGIQVTAVLNVVFTDTTASSQSGMLVTSIDQSDTSGSVVNSEYVSTLSISSNSGSGSRGVCVLKVRTSTSRTFRYRGISTTSDHVTAFCLTGWEDSIV